MKNYKTIIYTFPPICKQQRSPNKIFTTLKQIDT